MERTKLWLNRMIVTFLFQFSKLNLKVEEIKQLSIYIKETIKKMKMEILNKWKRV
jgi:hypothetical protein